MYLMNVIIDFLHLLASVAWIGGIIYTVHILMPSLASIDPPQRGPLQNAVAKRFTILSWSSVIVLAITGLLKMSWDHFFDFSILYTAVLNIKMLIFLVMVIIGFYITKVLGPKLASLAPKPAEAPSNDFIEVQKLLPKLVMTNLMLGVIVLLCVGLL